MTGWMMIAGLLLLGAVMLLVVAMRARRSDEGDGVTIRVTLAVATAVAAVAALGAVASAAAALVGPHVTIAIPVEEYWPQLPAGSDIEGPTAARVGGGFSSATVALAGLSTGARVCWAISQALAWIVPGAVAALVAVVCRQVRHGRPFAPVLARVTLIVAVAVAGGGTAAQVLGDIAGSMASRELLEWSGLVSTAEDAVERLPAPALLISFPFWPIGAGLGLAALATVLRRGRVLERDTEGLV